ncbi:MAG: hypothetical protein CM15mV7_2700 [uncultured marine virus]|nr:MAG: hypothetical protein CM15mV7_2700 [uncultured marine virus]
MPCAYLDAGSEKNLTQTLPNIEKVKRGGSRTAADTEKAYGYMPYKYCASNARVCVIQGITGSQG